MKKDIIKVTGAYLHQSVTWPGGPVASEKSLAGVKIKGLILSLLPQGLLIDGGAKGAILIPHANVANYIVELE